MLLALGLLLLFPLFFTSSLLLLLFLFFFSLSLSFFSTILSSSFFHIKVSILFRALLVWKRNIFCRITCKSCNFTALWFFSTYGAVIMCLLFHPCHMAQCTTKLDMPPLGCNRVCKLESGKVERVARESPARIYLLRLNTC